MASDFVKDTYLNTAAARKTRLIGFETSYGPSGFALKPDHMAKLDEFLNFVSKTSSFYVWIIGYASKRGDANRNRTLSANRALSVQKYLAARNPLFADSDRLEYFDWKGAEYSASADDNSADMRAVEVHIFLGDKKPVPPPQIKKEPLPEPKLPGNPRFKKWRVAAAFGLQIPIPGATLGPVGLQAVGNVFGFKRADGNEEAHWYISVGVGAGISLPALGKLKQLGKLWDALTAAGYSGKGFGDPVSATNPFNFEDLEGGSVGLVQAGGGLAPPVLSLPADIFGDVMIPTGFQWSRMTVSNKMWVNSGGEAFFKTADLLTNVDVGGPQSALGAGAGGQGSVLIKVA